MLLVRACRTFPHKPLLSQVRALSTNKSGVPNLLTLAHLSVNEIEGVLQRAAQFKRTAKHTAMGVCDLERSLERKTIAIIFSKRSTRTRVASESSVAALGGHGMFLAPSDIQLGVNESLLDTARVVGSMVDGIMARVGGHHEVEGLASESAVPVINALSSRFHPTQILADLLTMLELDGAAHRALPSLQHLAGKKVAWVGDSNNILNDMIVTYPRLGLHLSIAAPQGPAYERDPVVWDLMKKGLADLSSEHTPGQIEWSHDPQRAVRDADFIVTDTWISMGDEAQKDQRLRDFQGFQVTEDLARRGGAKPDWKFLHCLPRKAEEVSDEVFYGPRSLVFPEAENRKWTIMACFDWLFGGRAL
ncbi:Similar to S.cerevisiae protein ARG3 (Ornithine carbamoyltransferase) [Malassezia sympodialis ATCC 42132]|uniref:ornithine carbamoyltransferase n=3 Tax=Malassezia sympodialis (strain ATCC 42132) TaxID=1230383 RepID=A0A1M8A8G7_MALS4|nr:Similar to S.cerevisiae protein ARG3 (Ornithine carbamoyltransferase) [Malassezia sympodialis ATCC 42132]